MTGKRREGRPNPRSDVVNDSGLYVKDSEAVVCASHAGMRTDRGNYRPEEAAALHRQSEASELTRGRLAGLTDGGRGGEPQREGAES